jgi:hypothetical protein
LPSDAGPYRTASFGRQQAPVVEQINQSTASGAHGIPEACINGGQYRGQIGKDEHAA